MQSINVQRYGFWIYMLTMAVIAISAWYALHGTRANADSALKEPLVSLEGTTTKVQDSDQASGPTVSTETYRMRAQTTDEAGAGDAESVESSNSEEAVSVPEQPSYYLKLVPPEELDSDHDIEADVSSDSMLVQDVRL